MTQESLDLKSIAAAAWGGCVGWIVAALVTALARWGAFAVPAAFGSPYSLKAYEKLFYLTLYLAGLLCALLAVRFVDRFASARTTLLVVVVFVVFAPWLALVAVSGGPFAFVPVLPPLDPKRWGEFASAVTPLAYWLLVPIVALGAPFVPRWTSTDGARIVVFPSASAYSDRVTVRLVIGALACTALYAASLFPLDLQTVVSRIGYNQHNISFYVGPAMFFWANDRLVPGIDFFPQYGIGIGYLFSHFLRPTAEATIGNAVLTTAALSLFYFSSAFIVLTRVFRSAVYAFGVVTFGLILTFHASSGAVFLDPSAWPARYPFAFMFVGLLVLAADYRPQWFYVALAGCTAGLSLFWNTETGIYTVASGIVGALLVDGGRRAALINAFVLVAGAAITFMGLAALAYGGGVLQPEFFVGLIKPMTVYAEGFGATPIVWTSPLNILYAVATPIVGLSTLAWASIALLRGDRSVPRRTMIALCVLSMFGLGLMVKWVNMSFDALWHVNALPIIVVMAWWIYVGLEYIRANLPSERAERTVNVIRGGLVVVACAFLVLVRDDRNPSQYALQAFVVYPSVLLGEFEQYPRMHWNRKREASPADVNLLRLCSLPGERTMIVADLDWVYLLAAHRPPKMPWLPSPTISAFPFLIDASLARSGPIFLEGTIAQQSFSEPLESAVSDRLRTSYHERGVGKKLVVYTQQSAPPAEALAHGC